MASRVTDRDARTHGAKGDALGALGVRNATTVPGSPPPLPDSHSCEGTV